MRPASARYFMALHAAHLGDADLLGEVMAAVTTTEERIHIEEMLAGYEVEQAEQGLAEVRTFLLDCCRAP